MAAAQAVFVREGARVAPEDDLGESHEEFETLKYSIHIVCRSASEMLPGVTKSGQPVFERIFAVLSSLYLKVLVGQAAHADMEELEKSASACIALFIAASHADLSHVVFCGADDEEGVEVDVEVCEEDVVEDEGDPSIPGIWTVPVEFIHNPTRLEALEATLMPATATKTKVPIDRFDCSIETQLLFSGIARRQIISLRNSQNSPNRKVRTETFRTLGNFCKKLDTSERRSSRASE
jgi:hypothetical protein